MAETKMKVIRPFVEILEDGLSWKTYTGRSGVERRKSLYAPHGDAPHDHLVRTRLLAHQKWTPKVNDIPTTAGDDCIAAVECVRVLGMMQRRGIDISAGSLPAGLYTAMASHLADSGDMRGLLFLMMENAGSVLLGVTPKSSNPFSDSVLVSCRSELSACVNAMFRDPGDATWGQVIKEAERLEGRLEVMLANLEMMMAGRTDEEDVRDDDDGGDGDGSDETDGDDGDDGDGLTEEELEAMRAAGFKMFECGRPGALDDGKEGAKGEFDPKPKSVVPWGRLIHQNPPLERTVPAKKGVMKLVATSEGVYLRDTWRMATDQHVFTTKRRRIGGAVLIDTSGSMSLGSHHVRAISLAAPAVSVAAYSGMGDHGWLRVLVHRGRMVKDSDMKGPGGGGNVVDVPAIQEWLAIQPHPRIWVSDGVVTGKNDLQTTQVLFRTLHLMKKYKIIRVHNTAEALKLFRRIIRHGYSGSHPAMYRGKPRLGRPTMKK